MTFTTEGLANLLKYITEYCDVMLVTFYSKDFYSNTVKHKRSVTTENLLFAHEVFKSYQSLVGKNIALTQ